MSDETIWTLWRDKYYDKVTELNRAEQELVTVKGERDEYRQDKVTLLQSNLKLSVEIDQLEAGLATAVEALEKIAADFNTDFCSGNTVIAHEALTKLGRPHA